MNENCKCNSKKAHEHGSCMCGRNSNSHIGYVDTKERFFIAVDDITYFKAHYDTFHKEVVLTEDEDYREGNSFKNYHYRNFGEKFVNDPMIAALNAIAINSKESNNPEFREWFIDNIRYCKESNCFYIDEYLTLGVNLPPKACQWEHFFEGKYEFICVRHEIQVLETFIPKINLNSISKGIGFNKVIKELPDPRIESLIQIGDETDESFSLRYKLKDLPIEQFKC